MCSCFIGPHEFLGFLNIVMTGLLSQMPRAISATVQGLSRLVHRFYGSVEPVADKLLKTVLTLVRAKSKEIDAAVLGFLNVSQLSSSECNNTWLYQARFQITKNQAWIPMPMLLYYQGTVLRSPPVPCGHFS